MDFWENNEPAILLLLGFLGFAICALHSIVTKSNMATDINFFIVYIGFVQK